MKLIHLFTIIIFLSACSSTEEPTTAKENYSEETNRAFRMIEYSTPKTMNRAKPIVVESEKKSGPRISPPETKTQSASVIADEKMIELNQNLAFYCMKHRKSSKFGGSEERCNQHVKRSLEICQNKNIKNHKKLLACTQGLLKK